MSILKRSHNGANLNRDIIREYKAENTIELGGESMFVSVLAPAQAKDLLTYLANETPKSVGTIITTFSKDEKCVQEKGAFVVKFRTNDSQGLILITYDDFLNNNYDGAVISDFTYAKAKDKFAFWNKQIIAPAEPVRNFKNSGVEQFMKLTQTENPYQEAFRSARSMARVNDPYNNRFPMESWKIVRFTNYASTVAEMESLILPQYPKAKHTIEFIRDFIIPSAFVVVQKAFLAYKKEGN